jgi:hypothetical protein
MCGQSIGWGEIIIVFLSSIISRSNSAIASDLLLDKLVIFLPSDFTGIDKVFLLNLFVGRREKIRSK